MLAVCTLSLLITLMSFHPSSAKSDWNQETRDFIVKIHNDKRRGEGGCQINKMTYDMELERQARQWAENCVFKHELKDDNRGENLAFSTWKHPEKQLIEEAANDWFNEKNQYSYGQHSCGSSGACHYTQMVWHSTNKIGCYTTWCPNLAYGAQNAWYFVCFYTPRGNWDGEKPYEKSCKSQCQKTQTVDNGLCVGEEECVDSRNECGMWAEMGECQNNPKFMLKDCKKSCSVCKGDGAGASSNTNSNNSNNSNNKNNGGGCVDSREECKMWAQYGECKKNPGYMLPNCKKSCNNC